MTPIVDVHHAVVSTADAYIMPPPVSVASIPVSRQLQVGSTSSLAPDCSSTVSSHLALAN